MTCLRNEAALAEGTAAQDCAGGARPYHLRDTSGGRMDTRATTGPRAGAATDAFEQLRRRERQQALVAELGRSALTGTALDRLVEDAVSAVLEAIDADRVALLEPDGNGGLACRSSRGWPQRDVRPVDAAADSQVAWTFRRQEPCVVADLRSDERFPDSRHVLALGLSSSVSVPLRGEGQAVGVLVAHAARPAAFGEDEVVFLRAVANLLAVVSARERAEARRRESEEAAAFLADAGHSLAESLDYDATLRTLAELVVPRLADWFICDLAEPDGVFRRVAVAAASPEKQEFLERLRRDFVATVDGPSPASRALTLGETVHFPEFTAEDRKSTRLN